MKRVFSLLLAGALSLSLMVPAFAASNKATNAADALYDLGLFSGTGTNADGTPIYDLDRAPTRHEAVTMLVSLLGKKQEALNGTWATPFSDVANWAKPFVGYAYSNGLTAGTSATTYSGDNLVTAAQYLTFVLKVLGYEAGTDFQWDKAWELSDKIGLTNGEYNAKTTNFTRGDVAIISRNALSVSQKGSNVSLGQKLGVSASQPTVTPSQPAKPAEPAPASYTVNGISYVGKLGAPVLGKAAAELSHTESSSAAAQKINNVGDAIHYIQAKGPFDQPFDVCTLFTQLIGGDYDEVGLIFLQRPDNGYVLAYIQQDGTYYPMDLFSWAKGRISWIEKEGYSSGADLNILCDKLMTSFPYNPQKAPMTEWSVKPVATYRAEAEKELIAYLTTPQYTKEQIDQWVAEGLTLEQWAEKIRVPADAIQALNALGYRAMLYNDNVTFNDRNGSHWGGMWNAQTVFDHRSGNCGGTSHIMNALLSGDFDEQGYVEYNGANGGHIFNYFVSDGIYAMCDFVDLFADEITYIDNDSLAYIVYTGSDVHAFAKQYMDNGHHNDPNNTEYIYHLFMHPRDGAKVPKGHDANSEQTKFDNVVWDILPAQYKDDYTILYEREGYPIRFRSIASPNTWPKEIR